jgi:hypothetical protein
MKTTYTTDQAIELAEKEDGRWMGVLLDFFPNYWGINLVSVESISIDKQDDGQLKEVSVKFKTLSKEEHEKYVREYELNYGKKYKGW